MKGYARPRMAKAVQSRTRASAGACCPRPGRLRPRATRPFADLFCALGDSTRLEIVGLLAAVGSELCVCDIESHFDLSQPTVSHHLRILREAGLVVDRRDGRWIHYAIAEPALAACRLALYEMEPLRAR